jgi:phosphoribosyl-AMP cyclohydrolase
MNNKIINHHDFNQQKIKQILVKLKFNDQGLITAIAQDSRTKKVLMLAWMNLESIEKTIESGYATYFSRSRNEIWRKGETSGNLQKIIEITADCDFDCLLLSVEQVGNACHTGKENCFFNKIL